MSNRMSNSQVRSRSRGGRYGVSPNKQKVAEQEYLAKPHMDTSKERTTHLREKSSLDSVVVTEDRKDGSETISRVHSHALVCSWITSALQTTTKFILLVVALFLFKSMIQADLMLPVKTLASCFAEKETSCYSKFENTFFPDAARLAVRHWVSFQISDSNFLSARPIYKIEFPLLFDNSIVWLIAAIAIAIVYWLLGYIYRLLIDVVYTANAATSQRHLREK
jgi:hypothetical protein